MKEKRVTKIEWIIKKNLKMNETLDEGTNDETNE